MKKSTIIFISVLGALFMFILITRPYERNYNIDEEAGMKNIISKVKDLVEHDSVYKIDISTQSEQKDMDFLVLEVMDVDNNHHKITYNRSGAFFPSIERKELGKDGKTPSIDISTLSNSLRLIENCKKLIPDGYIYRHTEDVGIRASGTYIVFAVAPQDKNNIKKNKYVYSKTYKKESYSGGRRPRKNTEIRKYYIMRFDIDRKGEISIR